MTSYTPNNEEKENSQRVESFATQINVPMSPISQESKLEHPIVRLRTAHRTVALVEGDTLARLSELQLNPSTGYETPSSFGRHDLTMDSEDFTCQTPVNHSYDSRNIESSYDHSLDSCRNETSHFNSSENEESLEESEDSNRTTTDYEEEEEEEEEEDVIEDNDNTSDEDYIVDEDTETESEEDELIFDEEEDSPRPTRKLCHETNTPSSSQVFQDSFYSETTIDSKDSPKPAVSSNGLETSLEAMVLEEEDSFNTTQDSLVVIAQVIEEEEEEDDEEEDKIQSIPTMNTLDRRESTSRCVRPNMYATKGSKTHVRTQGVKKGKWTLGSKIGVGSFGVVHVGMNTSTGTLMAVKCIHITSDTDTMEDLEREIDLMKSLNHVHIVRYIGVERDSLKDMLYIFQEWVPGGSISSLLSKFGPFSMPVVRSYLHQIVLGLQYLHSKNILHRDIKGGNVLVNDEGVVKLADFGASKQMLSGTVDDAMEQLTMRGTPYFMALEVFEETYGQKADIWSCAGVAFQMLTAQSPWKDLGLKSPMSLYLHLKKTEGPPPIPKEAHASTDPMLMKLLTLCFDRDPKKRPSASELLEHEFFLVEDETDDEDESCHSPNSNKCLQSPPFLSPKDRMKIQYNNLDSEERKKEKTKSPLLLQYDTSEWPDWAKN